MRVIDWPGIFREHRVEFIMEGHQVGRGEIAIKCPFCGSADPSHHMGLNLETGWWSCWRNRAQHSGKSPVRLLMRLLRVSFARAREIAGLEEGYIDPEGFDALAARILRKNPDEPTPTATQRRFLDFEHGSMVPLKEGRAMTRRHWDYLVGRGFNPERLVTRYKVMAGVGGDWHDRVIIPFYQNGELVTWTGRAIGQSRLRYRDLSVEDSLMAPKETLLNYDEANKGGHTLIVQEGPVDVLKVDLYAHRFGVRSVGLCTNSMSEDQAHMIRELAPAFERVIIAMDTKSVLGIADSMRMKRTLSDIPNLGISSIPFGAGDGGALSASQVQEWARNLTYVTL